MRARVYMLACQGRPVEAFRNKGLADARCRHLNGWSTGRYRVVTGTFVSRSQRRKQPTPRA